MDPLNPTQRRDLRAKAHHLEPVVTIGHHGVSAPVLHEIDIALLAHDLVKVRVLGDDREAREAMLALICAALDCAPVQHLGKVLVLWRPNPERANKAARAVPAAPPARKRAKTAVDPVRERRRRTQGAAGAGSRRRRGTA